MSELSNASAFDFMVRTQEGKNARGLKTKTPGAEESPHSSGWLAQGLTKHTQHDALTISEGIYTATHRQGS